MNTQTVGQAAISRAGFLGARKALAYAVAWFIACNDVGHDMANVEEYAAWWGQSVRRAYLGQAAFRRAFPEFATPTALAAHIGYDYWACLRGSEDRTMIQLLGMSV